MSFIFGKGSVSSVFCDFSSEFIAADPTFAAFGLKWPDDFEKTPDVGNSRFQITRDLKSGACLLNHEGRLYPYTERTILERKHKLKENLVKKQLGERTPFRPNSVFFLETGFNLGNVEFINFDLKRGKQTSFESYRKIAYSFPLFWLLNEVVALEETMSNKDLTSDRVEQLENDKILKNEKLNGWRLAERNTSPSADEYLERCERPLHDYYFSRDDQVHIWLKFEFFGA